MFREAEGRGRMGRRMRGAMDAWGTMVMGAVGGGYKKRRLVGVSCMYGNVNKKYENIR